MPRYLASLSLLASSAWLSACTPQAASYRASPVCKQAESRCRYYSQVRKQAGKDNGAALELIREDCEASQRACAESVRYDMDPQSDLMPKQRF